MVNRHSLKKSCLKKNLLCFECCSKQGEGSDLTNEALPSKRAFRSLAWNHAFP